MGTTLAWHLTVRPASHAAALNFPNLASALLAHALNGNTVGPGQRLLHKDNGTGADCRAACTPLVLVLVTPAATSLLPLTMSHTSHGLTSCFPVVMWGILSETPVGQEEEEAEEESHAKAD